jgi:predicted MFS family arabinose efflux permease
MPEKTAPHGHQWLLGTACGLVVANLYYAQPLTGLIGHALGMSPSSVGLIVTLPLLGYGLGLILVVPLGDRIENLRLVLTLIALEAACLLGISFLGQPVAYLAVAFLVGMAATAVQVLVPYVTYLVPPERSGQAIGKVMSGLMLGIMLARPVASLVTDQWSWRTMFRISAALMVGSFVALRIALPRRQPAPGLTYGALLRSMGRIFATTEILRRRAFYQACMFGAFSVFWTAAPLWLSGPEFALTQRGIAWVALAGVAGAIAPPFAGKLADRGLSRLGTIAAMLLAAGAFLLSNLARGHSGPALGLVVACAVLLDFAVSGNLVLGQRAIYALNAEERSRINGLYIATFFAGGAVSSALSGWAYSRFGWGGASALGVALPVVGLVYLATERREAAKGVDAR